MCLPTAVAMLLGTPGVNGGCPFLGAVLLGVGSFICSLQGQVFLWNKTSNVCAHCIPCLEPP